MNTETKRPPTKRVENGKAEYRGVAMRRYDDTRPGYWGHWRTGAAVVNGVGVHPDLRSGSMKGLKHAIDEWLLTYERRLVEAKERAAAEHAVIVRRATNSATWNRVTAEQPTGPWHVEEEYRKPGFDTSYRVMPSSLAKTGSLMPVAGGIHQPHVATMMAKAPELVAALEYALRVLEANGWHRAEQFTGGPLAHKQLTDLLDEVKQPFTETPLGGMV